MQFTECESLNINYNVMGIATVTYTIVTNDYVPSTFNYIYAGGVSFNGIVTNVSKQPIPNTENATGGPWYTVNVTLIALGV